MKTETMESGAERRLGDFGRGRQGERQLFPGTLVDISADNVRVGVRNGSSSAFLSLLSDRDGLGWCSGGANSGIVRISNCEIRDKVMLR